MRIAVSPHHTNPRSATLDFWRKTSSVPDYKHIQTKRRTQMNIPTSSNHSKEEHLIIGLYRTNRKCPKFSRVHFYAKLLCQNFFYGKIFYAQFLDATIFLRQNLFYSKFCDANIFLRQKTYFTPIFYSYPKYSQH